MENISRNYGNYMAEVASSIELPRLSNTAVHSFKAIEQDFSLEQIFQKYMTIQAALADHADRVPTDSDDFLEGELQQIALLDLQVGLLEKAYTMPILTITDAQSKMKLWEQEVLQGRDTKEISAADALVKSVFDFMKNF